MIWVKDHYNHHITVLVFYQNPNTVIANWFNPVHMIHELVSSCRSWAGHQKPRPSWSNLPRHQTREAAASHPTDLGPPTAEHGTRGSLSLALHLVSFETISAVGLCWALDHSSPRRLPLNYLPRASSIPAQTTKCLSVFNPNIKTIKIMKSV